MVTPKGRQDHESEVRKAVAMHFGRELGDSQWDHWLETAFCDGHDGFSQNVKQDSARIIEVIEGSRRFMVPARRRLAPEEARERHEVRAEPPRGWTEYARGRVEGFRGTQASILGLFGLEAPLSLDEQGELITRTLTEQERTGESLILHYSQTFEPTLALRLPVHAEVYLGAENPYLDVIRFPERGRAYALYFLAREAERIAWQIGCEEWEAVDFLLSDAPLEMPWISIRTVGLDSPVLDVRIGSVAVTASEIARAYADALGELKTRQPQLFADVPRRRRRRKPRTRELLPFVDAALSQEGVRPDWLALRRRWNKEKPDMAYPSDKAMSEAYRRAKKDGKT